MKKNNSRKKKDGLYYVAIVTLVMIAVFSAVQIYRIAAGYMADRDAYSDIRDIAGSTDTEDGKDWEALRGTNPDVIAWIRLEDSNIDYPIVQGSDNDYYLHTRFDGTAAGSGTLFADYRTESPFEQFNTVVYGHHMKDGSMFGNLKKFRDIEYAERHRRFSLFTPNGKYDLDLVAFLNCPYDSLIYDVNVSGKSKDRYLKWIKDNSEYITDVTVDENDRLVILSTCAYEYEGARYVVVGKINNNE